VRLHKATHEQLRTHNRRLVLRALYRGEVDSRAALATATGLTKPTVSNLVRELLDEGLISEGGLGSSTGSGGKRPRLLGFEPDSRQVIGIAVTYRRVIGVLSNLAGEPTALHVRDLPVRKGALAVRTGIVDVVTGLLAQLDAPLLCLGLAVPGQVNPDSGLVRHSAKLDLADEPLAEMLAERFATSVHLGNYAELCALGQLAFGPQDREQPGTLVTIMLDENLELGVSLLHGARHYGTELDSPLLDELKLDWDTTRTLAERLRAEQPDPLLPQTGIRYLNLRYAWLQGDAAATSVVTDLAARLARLAAWIISILQPEQVSLVGGIGELGDAFLELLRSETGRLLRPGALQGVTFSMAYSDQLGAMGAVALATRNELGLF
jgi:predicted NBD/HSP70 family sugar kinase